MEEVWICSLKQKFIISFVRFPEDAEVGKEILLKFIYFEVLGLFHCIFNRKCLLIKGMSTLHQGTWYHMLSNYDRILDSPSGFLNQVPRLRSQVISHIPIIPSLHLPCFIKYFNFVFSTRIQDHDMQFVLKSFNCFPLQ